MTLWLRSLIRPRPPWFLLPKIEGGPPAVRLQGAPSVWLDSGKVKLRPLVWLKSLRVKLRPLVWFKS